MPWVAQHQRINPLENNQSSQSPIPNLQGDNFLRDNIQKLRYTILRFPHLIDILKNVPVEQGTK